MEEGEEVIGDDAWQKIDVVFWKLVEMVMRNVKARNACSRGLGWIRVQEWLKFSFDVIIAILLFQLA
jgi:hypothetical protein